jgi:rhamnosyltransferase
MSEEMSRIGAVIVAYHPDAEALQKLVANLAAQVSVLVVVDNTPVPGGASLQRLLPETVAIIADGMNHGIAAGLNIGLRFLIEKGCHYFLLSDQDSIPAGNLVHELKTGHDQLYSSGKKVGAVGAFFVDPRDGHVEGFEVLRWSGTHATTTLNADGVVEASVLITSGCLVSRAVLEDVGLMDEGLFIDYVDFEWCFRGAQKGYHFYGIPAATMNHTIGDDFRRVWMMGWRKKAVHSPIRVYYQNRNTLLLLRMEHVPLAWKLSRLLKRPAAIFFYLCMVESGWRRYAHSVFSGLRDGLTGKGGPYKAA